MKASEGGAIKYSIVRPTAFFKSVSGTYFADFPVILSILFFILFIFSFNLFLSILFVGEYEKLKIDLRW